MSGFERILAHVSSDALRDYCSSAIEDELKNLKEKMQSCLTTLEKALEVQDAILKLNVPLTENAATFAAIQSEHKAFNDDLDAFINEQKKIQAANAKEANSTPSKASRRDRTESVASSHAGDEAAEKTQTQQLTKLLGKIQHRLAIRRNDSWINKNIEDVLKLSAIAKQAVPEKAKRKEIMVVMDHFISSVLLSPLVNDSILSRLDGALTSLLTIHTDLDDFIESSRRLLASKRSAFAPQSGPALGNPPAPMSGVPMTGYMPPDLMHMQSGGGSVHMVDPHHFGLRNSTVVAEEPNFKKQKLEQNALDYIVKVERGVLPASVVAADPNGSGGVFEIYVSDLPWGTQEDDVASYFGIAGNIISVRMPTMDDGSTVGVAIIRFASFECMTTALRMDGYQFQGKTIHVKAK